MAAPPEKLAAYERLLRAVPGIEEKSNFGSGYTALNGNMYSMISKHGVVGIRLSDADRAAFVAEFGAEPFRGDPAWPPSKELIAVPDALLEDTATLTPWMERSFRHAQTLRPKPTKR
jgi:hypothetical protein